MTWAETTQLVLAVATLPVAALFIWRFSRDLWWRTWFGRSLMMIAVAVLVYTLSAVLFRLFGDYHGRSLMIVASSGLTFLAMLTRTVVLINAQNSERRSRALTEHRH
jgi:hypothetical protein